jgi:hypothetical protein
MSLPSRLLGANPSIQVSTLLSGSLTTPSAKGAFDGGRFEFIDGSLLTVDASSVTFSSIPQTYRALILRSSARTTSSQTDTYMRYNGDSSSIYANHLVVGSGSSLNVFDLTAQTQTRSACLLTGSTQPAATFGIGYVLINDYSSTTKLKTGKSYVGTVGPSSGGEMQWYDNIYASTSAITTILLSPGGGNFVSGSRFNLYGVK